jgi:hypothetical protein
LAQTANQMRVASTSEKSFSQSWSKISERIDIDMLN